MYNSSNVTSNWYRKSRFRGLGMGRRVVDVVDDGGVDQRNEEDDDDPLPPPKENG
jgi:hypothetical protein